LDEDGFVSRLYGVGCWPTTVSLNEDMRVEHIQFGVAVGEARAAKMQVG